MSATDRTLLLSCCCSLVLCFTPACSASNPQRDDASVKQDASPEAAPPLDQDVEQQRDAGGESGAVPVNTWIKRYDWLAMEGGAALLPQDDGLVVAGDTLSEQLSRELMVIKLDPRGELIWQTVVGGAGWEKARSLAAVDQRILALGQAAGGDLWLIELDSATGELGWQRSFGGEESESGESLAVGPDSVYLAGYTDSFGAAPGDLWVLALDRGGETIRWQHRLGGGEDDVELATAMVAGEDTLWVAGTSQSFQTGDLDGLLLALDKDGQPRWQGRFSGERLDRLNALVLLPDGVLAVGSTRSAGAGGVDGWVVKLDATGEVLWQRTLGGAGDDWLDAAVAIEQGLVLVGRTESFGGDSEQWIVRLHSDGQLAWSRRIGGFGDYHSASAVVDLGGGLAVAGFVEEENGDSDWLVAVLSYQGSSIRLARRRVKRRRSSCCCSEADRALCHVRCAGSSSER